MVTDSPVLVRRPTLVATFYSDLCVGYVSWDSFGGAIRVNTSPMGRYIWARSSDSWGMFVVRAVACVEPP